MSFSAQDSLVIVTHRDSADRGALHGKAQMSYREATLKANVIQMNFKTSVLRATGPPSDTAAQSRPVFQRGQGQSFTGNTLSFNLRTMRGRVEVARTQQQQGYVQGEAVKVYEDSTLFVNDGSYTTCNCPPDETPSYSLRSNRMKLKNRWVYTGPIQLYLFNIPTPLWLPFGLLPNVPGRRSGPLSPRYGRDAEMGLFLEDLGWYFALNDYTDLQLRASIWSRGSFEFNPIFRYAKRYAYDGQLSVTYRRTRTGERTDPDFRNQHRGQLRWNHSQNLSPTADLQGDVTLVTSSDFARRNSRSYDEAVRQEISSNLRYSKNWPGGGQNLSVSASQRQQLSTGEVSLTLPSLSFSQRSFKPFEVEQAVGDQRWYEKITTSYDFTLDNRYSFRPRNPDRLRARGDSSLADSLEQAGIDQIEWYEALFNRQKYQLATGNQEPFDFRARHQIPLSASFRFNRYNLNLSPNLNYNSDWRISTRRRFVRRDTVTTNGDSTQVEETIRRSEPGFFADREFSMGISSNTELFGTFPLRVGPFQGLRHRMSPSLSFRFRPNFNAPFWGKTRPLRYENGDPVIDERTGEPLRYDITNGQLVRGSSEQRSLSFSLNNEFETKHVQSDSTGERTTETLKLLDVDLGTSYNFAADSLNLSDIDLRARTRIEDFSINTSMIFSPYALQLRSIGSDGTRRYRRADRLMIAENPLTPVRLTNFRLNISGSFQSQGQGSRSAGRGGRQSPRAASPNRPPGQGQQFQQTRRPQGRASSGSEDKKGYLDASLPWTLNFNFSYNLRRPAKQIQSQNATVNARFTVNVTPAWSLSGQTGYDFIQSEVVTTEINLQRDLGCWVMALHWVPFGEFQSYGFNLHVKSGHLSQLLRLQIPNSGGTDRLGGFGNRLRGAAGGLGGGRRRGGGGLPF